VAHMAGRRVDEAVVGGAASLALFDVLGRRWALRVVWWEPQAGGLTYRDLAASIPDMSSSVLTQRLRDLRAARLVDQERLRCWPPGRVAARPQRTGHHRWRPGLIISSPATRTNGDQFVGGPVTDAAAAAPAGLATACATSPATPEPVSSQRGDLAKSLLSIAPRPAVLARWRSLRDRVDSRALTFH
jgi:DNA-binding transcriptional ArsR family regulator